jgi:hypothetical protein
MYFKIENDAMQEALRIITRVAPPADGAGNITIRSTGKKVYFNSSNDTNRCEINVPADVSGKENVFAVSLNAMRDATKGRGTLEVAYEKTLCKIKSGNYKSELPTVDAMQIDEGEDKKGESLKVDAEQAKWLRSALSTVSLKPTQLIATYMPLSIKLTKKGAFVSCYDPNHMAFINSSEITGDLEVRVPLDMFSSVLDVFDKSGFSLALSPSSLYVSNKLVKVIMALPEVDENDLKLDEVLEAAKGSKAAKGIEINIDKAEILKFMDNARAVATKERSEIKIQFGDNKMRMEVSTSNGSVKTVLKSNVKKSVDVLIDFEYLDEAIRKSGPQVDMKLVDSEFIAFKLAKGTVVVSLNQEG